MSEFRVALILLSGLGAVCIVAIFEAQWRYLIKTVFQMVMSPVAVAEQSLDRFWTGAGQFFRGQFANKKGELDLRVIFYHLIGALIYTTSFALFIFADFHLMCLTLAGMGIESSHFVPPMGAGSLTVLALIAGVLFFGTLLLDLLGMTEVAPWKEKLTEGWKIVVSIICIFALILSILIAGLCGFWRGKSLADEGITSTDMNLDMKYLTDSNAIHSPSVLLPKENIESDNDLDWILVVINIAIPTVLLLGGCLSGWGIVELSKFVLLSAIFLTLSPAGILLVILSYTTRIIDRVYEVALALIGLLAVIGRWLLKLFRYKPPYGQLDYPEDNDPNNGGGSNEAVIKGENETMADSDDTSHNCETEKISTEKSFNPYG